jgi:hypothetical protein
MRWAPELRIRHVRLHRPAFASQRPTTMASSVSIGRASIGVGTTRAPNRDGGSPGSRSVSPGWHALTRWPVSGCRLWLSSETATLGLPTRGGSRPCRYRCWGSSATVLRPRRSLVHDGTSPCVKPSASRDLSSLLPRHLRDTSPSPRCHRDSVTSATRLRTRDRDCTALVAMEGLQQFTSRMIPRPRRDVSEVCS